MKTIRVPKGKSFRSQLLDLGACREAQCWAGKMSLRTAWKKCPRADWMVWWIYEINQNLIDDAKKALDEWLTHENRNDAIRSVRHALEGTGGLNNDCYCSDDKVEATQKEMADALRKAFPEPPEWDGDEHLDCF